MEMRNRYPIAAAAFATLLVGALSAALPGPTWAVPVEEDLEARVRATFSSREDATPAEIKRIDAALAEKHPGRAFELATGIVERPEPPIARQREAYIKSLALLRRAQARRDLSQNQVQVNQDLLQAARLGNLQDGRNVVGKALKEDRVRPLQSDEGAGYRYHQSGSDHSALPLFVTPSTPDRESALRSGG